MDKKGNVALSPDRAGIEKPSELAVPEEETQAGNVRAPENQFFRMQIELDIQAV